MKAFQSVIDSIGAECPSGLLGPKVGGLGYASSGKEAGREPVRLAVADVTLAWQVQP